MTAAMVDSVGSSCAGGVGGAGSADHGDPDADAPTVWDRLLGHWRDMDAPEGWRAEISGGRITLVPPPGYLHNRILALLNRQLARALPDDLLVYQTQGILIPALERLYVPDLLVLPAGRGDEGGDPCEAPDVLLAVEVTSKGNAGDERQGKAAGYALGEVPAYLLIDRFDAAGPTVTLFTKPERGVYASRLRTPFGEAVELPKPFSVKVDTAEFPTGE
ncbi:Uma2 family endonuclease [Streptomyces sp. BI20]|uniref:Uma2 family endonuclease n=1 Tax=Streptomyces sp. BI20 TaxID=3403460 RepID=UPI003C782B2E